MVRGDYALIFYTVALGALYTAARSFFEDPAWKATAIAGTYFSTLASVTVAYRLSPWHPLAEYPGPLLWRVTSMFLTFVSLKGKRHFVLDKLHKKYGPFLRIGAFPSLVVSWQDAERDGRAEHAVAQHPVGDVDLLDDGKERGVPVPGARRHRRDLLQAGVQGAPPGPQEDLAGHVHAQRVRFCFSGFPSPFELMIPCLRILEWGSYSLLSKGGLGSCSSVWSAGRRRAVGTSTSGTHSITGHTTLWYVLLLIRGLCEEISLRSDAQGDMVFSGCNEFVSATMFAYIGGSKTFGRTQELMKNGDPQELIYNGKLAIVAMDRYVSVVRTPIATLNTSSKQASASLRGSWTSCGTPPRLATCTSSSVARPR